MSVTVNTDILTIVFVVLIVVLPPVIHVLFGGCTRYER